MSDDEVSKQAGKAFQGVAIGAAGLVGGLPGVALTVGATGLINVFESLLSGKTDAFNEARFAALEDEVRRVADEVKKIEGARAAAGKPAERRDPIAEGVLFSEFAEAVANAPTSEKRTALVHAASRQFDPDLGSVAVRKHWFNEVRELSDMEVYAIRMLAREGVLTFNSQHKVNSARNETRTFLVLPLTDDEHIALRRAVLQLAQGIYVTSPPETQRRTTQYKLSISGRILARYIDDTPKQPSEDSDDD